MRRKNETWFHWKYRTDPEFRKNQNKRSRDWLKKHSKKKSKDRHQKRDPKKLQQYRERYERKEKRRTKYKKTKIKKKNYVKKLRRKKQIIKARKRYERKNKEKRKTASRKYYHRTKKINLTKIKVFCRKHPKERLRKMHYVMNQKGQKGIRTTDWHYCKKCKRPYQIELVPETVFVYKVKSK